MVHALNKVHGLLKADGILIDIRPTGDPPAIEVHVDGRITHAGWYQETDNFVEYFQAQDVMDEAMQRGLFVLEQAGTFAFLTHAATIHELRDYVVAEYSDAIVDEAVVQRADELFRAAGRDKEIVLREITHIGRLRPG